MQITNSPLGFLSARYVIASLILPLYVSSYIFDISLDKLISLSDPKNSFKSSSVFFTLKGDSYNMTVRFSLDSSCRRETLSFLARSPQKQTVQPVSHS